MKINRIGAIGEVYTDTETGKMYNCIYSYKDSNGNVDCTWKEIGNVPEKQSEKIPDGKISEKQIEIVEEKPVEPVKEYPNNKPNKTRYTNYSKK